MALGKVEHDYGLVSQGLPPTDLAAVSLDQDSSVQGIPAISFLRLILTTELVSDDWIDQS